MLTNFIHKKIQGTNWDGVDIVCHSMGGFVSRAAIMNHCAPFVSRLIKDLEELTNNKELSDAHEKADKILEFVPVSSV